MLAGLAVLVAAVALAVLLPVAGLIVSLAGITLLRAADRAQSALAVRRSVRGPRASDLLVVVVTAPWAVARALLTETADGAAGVRCGRGRLRRRDPAHAPPPDPAARGRVRGGGDGRLVRRRPRLRPAAPTAEPDGGRRVARHAVLGGHRGGGVGPGRRDRAAGGVAGPGLLAGRPRRTCPRYTGCSRPRRTGCSGTLTPNGSPDSPGAGGIGRTSPSATTSLASLVRRLGPSGIRNFW